MIYDLAIIGAGPAGYSAALEAVKFGLNVIIFEKEYMGGTCLNRGCVPTKFLVHIAELSYCNKQLHKYGVENFNDSLDFDLVKKDMKMTVEKLRVGLEKLLVSKKITIIYGIAHLQEDGKVWCNSQQYEAKNILIATGSKTLTIANNNRMSSDDFLKMNTIPKSALIIGGGVMAVEFAYILNKLGSEVTLTIRGERILRGWDKELATSISLLLKKNGINIITNCNMQDLYKDNYEIVLSAFGRVPNRVGTENARIKSDDENAIWVSNLGETNIKNIYAAGDVISGSSMLAHRAMEQGRNVVRLIAGKTTTKSVLAKCIYICPEVASVGMTELEAKNKEIDAISAKVNMVSNSMTCIYTEERSFIKVVAEKKTHKIIGAQLMCERASDIASEFVIIINNEITIEKCKESVHPHPSFSEAIEDVLDVLMDKLNEV